MTTLRTPDSLATVWLSALHASGRSPATLTQYAEAMNCYLPWLGHASDTATRLDARRFQQHLLDTRSPGRGAVREDREGALRVGTCARS